MPTIGFETPAYIFRESYISRTIDADMVRIVVDNQVSQPKMTGQRAGFAGYSLHHAPIAGKRKHKVIENLMTRRIEMRHHLSLCNSHTDRRRNSLPQGPRCCLDTRRSPIFRMARAFRSDLTESFYIIER